MELEQSPHQPNKGMTAAGAEYLKAVSIAQQTGKSVEEVLAFLNIATPEGVGVAAQTTTPEAGELPKELADLKLPLPVEETFISDDAKGLAPKVAAPRVIAAKDPTDNFVVTEVINPEDASEADLAKISEQEELENNWDGKIREGSKVRITHSAPGSRIKWTGKIGKVIRIIGNENAKVYEIEFKGQKIPKIRLNKTTGKLEKGYENKKLATTFDVEDIELVD